MTSTSLSRTTDRKLLRLALPAVVASLATPLLSLTDTAFTGHMGGAAYIGAIAVGGNLFNLLYWLFGFLRMAGSGLAAQACGAADARATATLLRRSLLTAVAAGGAMIALQRPLEWAFGLFMQADTQVWQLATTYFRILVWGAPAVLATYALAGWFTGMQSTRSAMWMSIAVDTVNLALSALLVLGLGMKVEGVAVASLAAQWVAPAVALPLALRMQRRFARSHPEAVAKADCSWRRYLRMNTDIVLRTLCLVAVTLWFTRAGAAIGNDVLAANAVLMQLFILFSYFADGLAFAGEALVGLHTGAHQHSMASLAVRRLMRLGGWLAVAFTIAYFLGGELIIRLLSDDRGVREAARLYLPWAVAIPLAGVTAFLWDGVFVATASSRRMLLTMAAATAAYFGVLLAAPRSWGNNALWLAFITYLLTRSAVATLLRPRHTGKTAPEEHTKR